MSTLPNPSWLNGPESPRQCHACHSEDWSTLGLCNRCDRRGCDLCMDLSSRDYLCGACRAFLAEEKKLDEACRCERCRRCDGTGIEHWYLGDEFNSSGESDCHICDGAGIVENCETKKCDH